MLTNGAIFNYFTTTIILYFAYKYYNLYKASFTPTTIYFLLASNFRYLAKEDT